MKIQIGTKTVVVTGTHVRPAVESHLFREWVRTLDTGLTVHSIVMQSVDLVSRKGQKEVLFLKFKAAVTDSRGRSWPGIVFLRGSSVAILPIITTERGQYALLIKGSSVAVGGGSHLQLPAGMTDGSLDFMTVAQRELIEETGLDSSQGTLINLNEKFFGLVGHEMYPSPGACDEGIHFFLYSQSMSEEELVRFQEQETGLAAEHEHLVTVVVPLADLCRSVKDMKAHVAYLMYTETKERRNV